MYDDEFDAVEIDDVEWDDIVSDAHRNPYRQLLRLHARER